jgi:SIR2-like domain
MHEPEKIVIFAGAGLSAAVEIPAMNSFVDVLRDNYLTPKETRQLDAIMKDCATRASLIDSNIRNLEILASFVSMVRFSNPNYIFGNGDAQLTAKKAETFLLSAVSRVASVKLNTEKVAACTGLLHNLRGRKNTQSTIITTNYDMHIEMASAHTYTAEYKGSGVRLKLPKDAVVLENELEDAHGVAKLIADGSADDSNQPLLLKLHGSVNWIKQGRILEVHANLHALPGFDGIKPRAGVGHYTYNGNKHQNPLEWAGCDSEKLPEILLPTILKPGVNRTMQMQWEESARALREADQVWFIGYSFPESDSYMKYFLASCLADNTRVRQIAVIDPDRSVYYERASSVFADARLSAIMNMYPHKWTELNWDEVRKQNPLYKFTSDADVRRGELETRALKAHQGEYYVDANGTDQKRSSPRGRGRSRGEMRIR